MKGRWREGGRERRRDRRRGRGETERKHVHYEVEENVWLSCVLINTQMVIGRSNGATKAQITWKYDFGDCGLVVKEFRVKGRCSDSEDIEWRVIGDERVGCRPLLAGEEIEGETERGRGSEGEGGEIKDGKEGEKEEGVWE